MNNTHIPSFESLSEDARSEIVDAIKSLLHGGKDTRYIADLLAKPQSYGRKLTRTELLTLSNIVCDEVNKEIRQRNKVVAGQLRAALLESPTFQSLVRSPGAKFRI